MKTVLAFLLISITTITANAQLNPVSWSFSAKKIADKGFKINNNPLLLLEGKIKEVGKMEKFHDAKLEVSANQYANKVDFVQVVKLKANAKTNLTGSVEYQTCDDKKCLPPKTVNFTIPVK